MSASRTVGIAAVGAGVLQVVCSLGSADRATTPSASCLACHDGTVADAVNAGVEQHSHPIGVRYASAWRSRGAGLAGVIPRELVLVDGRVECTTCHDGRSVERAKLARAPRTLCGGCHAEL